MKTNYKKFKLLIILLLGGIVLPGKMVGQALADDMRGEYKLSMFLETSFREVFLSIYFNSKYENNAEDERVFHGFHSSPNGNNWIVKYYKYPNDFPNNYRYYYVPYQNNYRYYYVPYQIRINIKAKDYFIPLEQHIPYINKQFLGIINNSPSQEEIRLNGNVELIPMSIKLRSLTNGLQENKKLILPYDTDICLSATQGYLPSTYKWQYKVSDSSIWNNMPDNIFYSSDTSFAHFSGKDLFDEDTFKNLVAQDKRILFRINAITDETRDEANYNFIALRPTYETPYIVSHSITPEKCYNMGNASIKVFLNRKLLPNELLAITNLKNKETENVILQEDNSFIIKNLEAGDYSFLLNGTINGNLTYSETNKHQLDVTIKEQPRITANVSTIKQVSCYGGSDGIIALTASGGTGIFTVKLFDNENKIIETRKISAGSTTFSGLAAGKYKLVITDSNNCPINNEMSFYATITAPTSAVSIKQGEVKDPLMYNSSDGYINLLINGGTPSSSGYTVRYTSTVNNKNIEYIGKIGNDHNYILKNLPGGVYTFTVEDNNYSLLSAQDKQKPCGCKSSITIPIVAPEPIKVEIKQNRFISCYGSKNGGLIAHASGGRKNKSSRLPYTYQWYKVENGKEAQLTLISDSIASNLGAGNYKVKVIDYVGAYVISELFTIKQPQPLVLKFNTQAPLFNKEGYVQVVVTGGTPPYKYEWNIEGETKDKLSVAEQGNYFVIVTDKNGCKVTGEQELISPNAPKINPIVTNPTCYGSSNGSIRLLVTEGTPPYKIKWSDQATIGTNFERKNLKAGEYIANVIDSIGYNIQYKANLIQPDKLLVTLSEPFVLSKGQSRILTATSSQNEVSYLWQKDDKLLNETTSEIKVSSEGSYKVIVTNSSGCMATAEVDITVGETEIPLDITIPSIVSVESPIHAINISRVKAEKVEWYLPKEAKIEEQNNNEVIFKITQPGTYTITLVGYKDGCSASITQQINVTDKDINLPQDKDSPTIKQFLVTPNPTKGEFKILVELKSPKDFTLTLLSPTKVIMDKKEIKSTQYQTFDYELKGDISGDFFVELSVGGEKSIIRIIKQGKK